MEAAAGTISSAEPDKAWRTSDKLNILQKMYSFAKDKSEGYVLVLGADSGQLEEMLNIIAEEFDA